MQRVAVESFAQWRVHARALLLSETPPEAIVWCQPGDSTGLFEPGAPLRGTPRVPREFLLLSEAASRYRHPARWALLYRVLWRLSHGEPQLLRDEADPDVRKLRGMAAQVEREKGPGRPALAPPPPTGLSSPAVESVLESARRKEDENYPHDAAAELLEVGGDLDQLRQLALDCQACELHRQATQTVFGEGPFDASLMLVGEQPGDQEDRRGRPFVGPAGQLLRRLLVQAGVAPERVYFSNTVKHFRWEPSPRGGKRRLHQRATAQQIATCSGWVKAEIRLLRPSVLVCLGATAARALLGEDFRLGRERGRWISSPLAERVMATVHPSFLLRLSDPEERERQQALFLEDLRLAVSALPSTPD